MYVNLYETLEEQKISIDTNSDSNTASTTIDLKLEMSKY